MKKLLIPIIAACIMAPSFAFATHPLLTDSAETVAPKAVEAETAVEYAKNSGLKTFVLQETVTAGVIPKVDAFVAVPFQSLSESGHSESGLGDFIIGAKWNFAHVDKFALAIKPSLSLPVGDEDKGLGYGRVGFGATLVASTELANKLSVDGNLGLKHQGQKYGESFNEFDLSVAAKYDETENLKAVAEIAISADDQTGSKTRAILGVGAIYAAQKNLDVDLGLRFGLTSQSEDFRLCAGVTYKF